MNTGEDEEHYVNGKCEISAISTTLQRQHKAVIVV